MQDISPAEIRQVVRTEEEDRSSNVMLFGLDEEPSEYLKAVVTDVFVQLGEKPRCEDVFCIVVRLRLPELGINRGPHGQSR